MRHDKVLAVILYLLSAAIPLQAQNLVSNGGFEADADGNGIPDAWAAGGRPGAVIQTLTRDAGRTGGFSARLQCTSFTGGYPDSHAMLYQLNLVSVQQDRWYRLSFWAREQDLAGQYLNVALMEYSPWGSCGLWGGVRLSALWNRHELLFQANATAADTRLQFWFAETGTLWMDDIEIVEIPAPTKEYRPTIPIEGRKNFVPNSSFECGTAGWGSVSLSIGGFVTGNLSELYGTIDLTTAAHGRQSLRLNLASDLLPKFYSDYYNLAAIRTPDPLAAHEGWLPLQRDGTYVVSAYLKSDRAGVPAKLGFISGGLGPRYRTLSLTTDWRRYEWLWRADSDFASAFVGPDVASWTGGPATVWIDALQVEAASVATAYAPRDPVEVAAATALPGNIFTAGMPVEAQLSASNAGTGSETVQVRYEVTDWRDSRIGEGLLSLAVPAGGYVTQTVRLLEGLQRGFFRATFTFETSQRTESRSLRMSVIDRYQEPDSIFGINHAYPSDRIQGLAKDAGMVWVRDWSLKWDEVEPQPGTFQFAGPNQQIDRALQGGGHVLGLLPFPSNRWSTTAPASVPLDPARLRFAYLPQALSDFANYAMRCSTQYRSRIRVWEILNEPLYTSYTLPQTAGYQVSDYVAVLRSAYASLKATDPGCRVIGGIAGRPETLTKELIDLGGLDVLDILNLHIYPGATRPDGWIPGMRDLRGRMKAANREKPIWVTECAYYADDDYPLWPKLGLWPPLVPTEMQASIDLVKFNAILMRYGTEKIFYHSGAMGKINAENVESVFFEYGGAPRKMYPALAAMAQRFGSDTRFVREVEVSPRVTMYLFLSRETPVAILWMPDLDQLPLYLRSGGVAAYDLMGNRRDERVVTAGAVPVYLVGQPQMDPEQLADSFSLTPVTVAPETETRSGAGSRKKKSGTCGLLGMEAALLFSLLVWLRGRAPFPYQSSKVS